MKKCRSFQSHLVFSICLLGLFSTRAGELAQASPDPAFVSTGQTIVAEPFDLGCIRLLDGICRANQEVNGNYMLSLDVDRLLHNFRVNAKLPSTAKPYGGWEAPNCGLRGHFVGHYLSACAEMYAATGDKRFFDRGGYLVSELGKCQAALGNGYLSAFPPQVFDTLENDPKAKPWAPYYTVHKIMAGLLDQYHYCQNGEALKMVAKMADYFQARMAKLTPEQIDRVLNTVSARAAPGVRGNVGSAAQSICRNP